MPEYYSAAVCRRGHTSSSVLEISEGPVPQRCARCGAAVLSACPSCGYRLRGGVPGVIGFKFTPADFCDRCGTPLPWASRQARLYELENVLMESPDLTEADRLTISEQIEALTSIDPDDEPAQVERWQRIKRVAPALLGSGRAILVSVTTAAVQKQLGL
jgi:hypothetical protein